MKPVCRSISVSRCGTQSVLSVQHRSVESEKIKNLEKLIQCTLAHASHKTSSPLVPYALSSALTAHTAYVTTSATIGWSSGYSLSAVARVLRSVPIPPLGLRTQLETIHWQHPGIQELLSCQTLGDFTRSAELNWSPWLHRSHFGRLGAPLFIQIGVDARNQGF